MKTRLHFVARLLALWLSMSGFGPGFAATVPSKDEVVGMIEQEQFAELEKLTSELRAKRPGFYQGYSDLSKIYGHLNNKDFDELAYQRIIGKLEKWTLAYPDSPAPRAMLGNIYCAWAWEARGGGWASTVTEDGWRLFGERLARARIHLEEADKLTVKDPEIYRVLIRVALGQGWSKAEMDAAFKKGVKVEPNYMQLYEAKANFLLPRWHGEPGDWEAFAEEAGNERGGEDGDILYMAIARSVSWTEKAEFFDNTSASYERMKRGFEVCLQRYPTYMWDVNSYCYFACIAGDQETAKELFQKISDQWEQDVWKSKSQFDQWQNWAVNDAAAPVVAGDDSTAPALPPAMFKKILIMGGVIWLFIIAVVAGIIWAIVRKYQETDD